VDARRFAARLVLAAFAALPLLAAAANHVVTIEGFEFKPQTLHVKRGDTVEWVNKDILDHTATTRQPGFDSKAIKPGAAWRWTAQRAGQYPYICSFHPNMTGTVEVE
jgi:plastocyanin